MTSTPSTKPSNPKSPWRQGPACDTKRATLSFMRYKKNGKKTK